MSDLSLFSIVGPIMVGPSSSHTAGAAKIGKIARKVAGNDYDKVTFRLHGSFAKTYKGHGTDKALLGGFLGLSVDDENIKNSYEIAEKRGLDFSFIEDDLGEVHPNSVLIEITKNGNIKTSLRGESIGGGVIRISMLNGIKVNLSFDMPTLIVKHIDVKGIISKISSILAELNINIAYMTVYRETKGNFAYTIIETDELLDAVIGEKITDCIEHVKSVIII